ncbi:indolethylamine N-methyltransferase-like [Lissotriton helveticus]
MAYTSDLKELHERLLDPKKLMDIYAGPQSGFREDTVTRMIEALNKTFSLGGVKGQTLIYLSIGPYVLYLLPTCDYFEEIVIGGPTDQCLAEVEKWRTNAPGALDCSHAAQLTCELEGNREAWQEKQNVLQSKMKLVLKYDVRKSNPLCPVVLPQADCLFLKHFLESHVLDKEGFCCALGNVSSLLKEGGHLIIIAGLELTYFMVEDFKFPNLCITEDFVRKALDDACYVIEEIEVMPRSVKHLYDVADYTGILYVNARKK